MSTPTDATPEPRPLDAIDTHAHIYPAVYLDRLESIGVDPATTTIARNLQADVTDEDMSERLRWMDAAGVATQVLAVTPQVPSGPEVESSLEAATWINDCYADVVAQRPDRFLAYGALPLPHVEAALAELPRVYERGFVGVSLPTFLPGGQSLADPLFDDVWAALNERSAIVNIHPTGSGAYSPQIVDHGLTWVNGAPVEDGIAVLQLLKADIPARYPEIRFHVAHLGGDLPFMAQRLEDNYSDWGSFKHSPIETLRSIFFDAANFHEPSLRLAAETVGVGQILGGSDIPYFRADKYVRAFDYIRTSRLSDADKTAILQGNAEKLYRV